ncbi:TIGR02677 family protein [Anoxybacillus ayderensis]|uniref:TIGR02677 family protein n=1 Tax=Anoxybacillus ayderensis TaxID=265546 RepID=UPI000A269DA0|nr:TIGR02677 family protein [Anoxybacillus ayderensis]OSX54557.1 TIGR02677 family protein [Anoxybacillus ayderensis]
MDTSWLKPITEAKYLVVDNAYRYRAILRYFYTQHERMRQYLFPEEVYAFLKQFDEFQAYTEEEMQQDLEQLVKWKNLIARQETAHIRTIEEFKKKRFRYQCSPYTVEIERMIRTLEQLGDTFGGSLEKTRFDRLYASLVRIESIIHNGFGEKREEMNQVWEETFDYFKKIIQNSADYIAYLNGENMEERMMSDSFLAYKEQFTAYLRDFIVALQKTSMQIEKLLEDLPEDGVRRFIEEVVAYQLAIPRFEGAVFSREQLTEEKLDTWRSLKEWFLGRNGHESELSFLQKQTNEAIRRMTRVVQRLGERHHHFRSRKKDYLHLAKWFSSLETVEEAHKLSAVVFGCFHTKHIVAENDATENMYRDIWEEQPTEWLVKPRVRHYREKKKPEAMIDRRKEKEETMTAYLAEKQQEEEELAQLIDDGKIVLQELLIVAPHIRKTLLGWIAKAMGREDRIVQTENGWKVKVVQREGTITLEAEDGMLMMPNYEIHLLD